MGDTVWERQPPSEAAVDHALQATDDACFWLEEVADRPRHPPLTADHRADLAVVGGGYTGLWTAVRAKQRDPGRRVLLLEGRRLGWAASGRNGGFCAASITHGEENGRSRWPDEYDALDRLGEENLAGIEQTVRDLSMAVDYEHSGELTVAVEQHQVAWLREATRGRFLDREAVRAEVDSPTYLAGLVDDGVALLHPGRMVAELARVAGDLGVEVVEDSPVTAVEAGRTGPVRLRTGRASVSADRVALATNAFPALLRLERLRTVPVYDYVVMTEPLSTARLAEIGWRHRQGLADLGNQFHYYRLSADNRILFGGYDAVYRFGKRVRPEYEQRPASYRRLVSHLLTTFPQLEGVRVTHRWAGAIDTSTRFCAFWRLAHGGRVAHTAGFTGLGVGASRFAADVALDLLAGERTERTELEMVRRRPLPFPPEPLAALGIHATRWSLDRADHREGRRNAWLRGLDRCGLGF
ncbi:MAG TPA: FAD-dependent oxidoreductase, partial [Nocardioides sp.]|nr:FAD-dependent oxidoreductase [Nocardioides sp.]